MFKKILSGVVVASFLCVLFAVGCCAIAETDIAAITGGLSDFSVANVLTVIVACFGIAVPLVLIWFAVRKIWSWAKAAFFGG